MEANQPNAQGRRSAVKTTSATSKALWSTIRKTRHVDNVSRLQGKKINPCHGMVALVRTAPLQMRMICWYFKKAWISSYCLHITCLAKYLMLYREEHYCYTKWILHTPWFDFYVMMGCVPLTAYLWIIKGLKPRILEWLLLYIPFYKKWFYQKCFCRCL